MRRYVKKSQVVIRIVYSCIVKVIDLVVVVGKNKPEKAKQQTTTNEPQVVVFDDSTLRSQPAEIDRHEKKAFMVRYTICC